MSKIQKKKTNFWGRTSGSFVAAGVVASMALGCGSEPVAVEDPTWKDVYPILQGNCLHCHGGGADANGGTFRLDFNKTTACKAFNDDSNGESPPVYKSYADSALSTAEPNEDLGQRPSMPPRPARPLSAWEIQTLRNWEVAKNPQGKAPDDNELPTLEILNVEKSGSNRKITFWVKDPEGDPVLGKIKVTGNDKPFYTDFAGQHTITVKGTGTVEFEAVLCDGWKEVTRKEDVKLPK